MIKNNLLRHLLDFILFCISLENVNWRPMNFSVKKAITPLNPVFQNPIWTLHDFLVHLLINLNKKSENTLMACKNGHFHWNFLWKLSSKFYNFWKSIALFRIITESWHNHGGTLLHRDAAMLLSIQKLMVAHYWYYSQGF